MTFSKYGRLEPNDIIQKGDELRFATPASWQSQSCDECNDYSRMQWEEVSEYWIGKRFSEFLKGRPARIGRVDIRRRLKNA